MRSVSTLVLAVLFVIQPIRADAAAGAAGGGVTPMMATFFGLSFGSNRLRARAEQAENRAAQAEAAAREARAQAQREHAAYERMLAAYRHEHELYQREHAAAQASRREADAANRRLAWLRKGARPVRPHARVAKRNTIVDPPRVKRTKPAPRAVAHHAPPAARRTTLAFKNHGGGGPHRPLSLGWGDI